MAHKKYYINTLENGKITLVKVLNEYEEKEKAKEDLLKLVTHEIKENDLLKEFSKKNPL